MDLSERQLKLINYLFDFPNGVKMAQIEKEIGTSKRTIYRDIADLEQFLKPMNLIIENKQHLFTIFGPTDALEELHKKVQSELEEPGLLTIEQRQNAMAVRLLIEDEPIKMQSFAIDFHTSIATTSKDLLALEGIFSDYQITIKRQKSKGVEASGIEFDIRNLLNAIVDSELNLYDFFQILANPDWQKGQQTITKLFMDIIGFENFVESYEVVRSLQKQSLSGLYDEQLKRIVVILAVVLNRLKKKRLITELPQFDRNKILEDQKITLEIFLKLQPEVKQFITSLEVNYLTLQIQGLGVKKGQENVLRDYNLPLSVSTKELISQVSREVGWNFETDNDLFNEIMLVLENPLTSKEGLKSSSQQTNSENAELNISVMKKLKNLFTEMKLSNQQIKLIQELFQSSMKLGVKKRTLNVLVVCPNGISTAQILKTRLIRRIDEIGKVSVASTSIINDLQFDKYDLVLSTIDLSNVDVSYQLVSPLLLDEEIELIKKKSHEKLIQKSNEFEEHQENPRMNFEKFYRNTQEAHEFLTRFNVEEVENQNLTVAEILLKIVRQISSEIVKDSEEVTGRLLHRLTVNPVGIPKSNLGLIHTTSQNVTKPFVSIYELEEPIEFSAMDHSTIDLKRIVLIIGPEKMTEFENNLVGSVSTLIIQSQNTLDLFNEGSKEQLKDEIGKEFLKIIKLES